MYPRWVAQGRLTADKADHETACMRSILATLEGLRNFLGPSTESAETTPEPQQPTLKGIDHG